MNTTVSWSHVILWFYITRHLHVCVGSTYLLIPCMSIQIIMFNLLELCFLSDIHMLRYLCLYILNFILSSEADYMQYLLLYQITILLWCCSGYQMHPRKNRYEWSNMNYMYMNVYAIIGHHVMTTCQWIVNLAWQTDARYGMVITPQLLSTVHTFLRLCSID